VDCNYINLKLANIYPNVIKNDATQFTLAFSFSHTNQFLFIF